MGLAADGTVLGDITDEVQFSSDVATDVIDGNTVTFPTASEHEIMALHLPTELTDSVTITVNAVAGPPATEEPPAAGEQLPATGALGGQWTVAAAVMLMGLGALALVTRRRLV